MTLKSPVENVPKICAKRTRELAAPWSAWEYLSAAGELAGTRPLISCLYVYIYTHTQKVKGADSMAEAQCCHLRAVGSVFVTCSGALPWCP